MGSGASKKSDVIVEETVEEVDNYDELYSDKKDEEIVDVPLEAFPSLQNSRFWQSNNPVEPVFDEGTGKLLPKPQCYDVKFIEELKEKTVKTEFDESLLTSTVDSLVEELTKDCDSVADKVLTFYRWIRETESDVPSANVDHPAYYFAKNVKQPIALLELFQKLCESANIVCKIVRGYGKGASFARQLEKHWYLIDLIWCRQQQTDFYFLCEPAIFIYNHYPLEKDWQLLFRPVTKPEFIELAFLHKSFYHHDLELQSHQSFRFKSITGEEVIRLGYKEERIWSYRLTCEKNGAVVKSLGEVCHGGGI
ncbi:hypothetical protein EB796_025070 [Bugula neritina]|uniref:Uncharacterized protein n=1 Tax=Bugula neritina TaxID=10212 RepID=A0A7J7IT88_BUGNE|nr:hypothetical protein EB796_025070 [Bugula neritina]